MESSSRPWTVNLSAWLIMISSALFIVIHLVGFTFNISLVSLVFLLAGLIVWGTRLMLGLAIRKGLNWARRTYLIFDLFVVNAGLFGGGRASLSSQNDWLAPLLWLPIILYLVALLCLTRPAALAHFGRPALVWMKTRYIVLVVLLLSVFFSGAASLAYRLGATRLPAVADYLNPANCVRNIVAENPSLRFLETGHYREVRAIELAISQSKSLEELAKITASEAFREMKWVNDNSMFIFGVFLVSVLGVVLILRHP